MQHISRPQHIEYILLVKKTPIFLRMCSFCCTFATKMKMSSIIVPQGMRRVLLHAVDDSVSMFELLVNN